MGKREGLQETEDLEKIRDLGKTGDPEKRGGGLESTERVILIRRVKPVLNSQPHNFEISTLFPSPFRWGRVRVGVDKGKTLWSPLPFIPSHGGEGMFWGYLKRQKKILTVKHVRI